MFLFRSRSQSSADTRGTLEEILIWITLGKAILKSSLKIARFLWSKSKNAQQMMQVTNYVPGCIITSLCPTHADY